jgi:hypothetical protein
MTGKQEVIHNRAGSVSDKFYKTRSFIPIENRPSGSMSDMAILRQLNRLVTSWRLGKLPVGRQFDMCKIAKIHGTIAPASTYIDVS